MSVVRDPKPGPFDYITDLFKSNFTLMHVFSQRKKAPPFSFSLFLMLWGVWWASTIGYLEPAEILIQKWSLPDWVIMGGTLSDSVTGLNSEGGGPSPGSTPSVSSNQLLTRMLMHWLIPINGFFRTCLIGSMIIIHGYTYEVSSLGTTNFMLRFLSSHALLTVFVAFFRLGHPIFGVIGLEPTLCFMQCLFSFDNPIVPNQVVSDEWLKVKAFHAIEPRWHGWIILIVMCVTGGQPWSWTFYRYGLGIGMGAMWCLRHPSTWPYVKDVIFKSERNFVMMLGLWAVALLRWPVTSPDFQLIAFLLHPPSWFQSSPYSFVNLALFSEPMPEALFLISTGLACIPPVILLLCVDRHGFGWVKKVYGAISIILAMSIMNTKSWMYMEIGFVILGYSVWGFFSS